jgi:hypothetical protein
MENEAKCEALSIVLWYWCGRIDPMTRVPVRGTASLQRIINLNCRITFHAEKKLWLGLRLLSKGRVGPISRSFFARCGILPTLTAKCIG